MITKSKAWINALLLLLTLIINTMGALGLINNMSQKEISDLYPTLITPAPFAFSIWSVIYTLLIISILTMIIRKNDAYFKKAVEDISYLFWASCVLNAIWIVSFSYNLIGLSTAFIFLLTLIMTLIVKAIGNIQNHKHLLLPTTFGLYAGWLLIATVVNLAAWLVKIEWDRFGISAEIWSGITLLIAIALTAIVVLKTQNSVLPLPIAWAYFGIYKSLNAAESFDDVYTVLPIVALMGIFLLIGISVFQFYKNSFSIMPIK